MIPLSEREQLRDTILRDVCRKHRIAMRELLGKKRYAEYVAARKEATQELKKAGFAYRAIARILHRDKTTVEHYLGLKKKSNRRLPSTMSALPDDVQEAVRSICDERKVIPALLITEWITERARFEASKHMRRAA